MNLGGTVQSIAEVYVIWLNSSSLTSGHMNSAHKFPEAVTPLFSSGPAAMAPSPADN